MADDPRRGGRIPTPAGGVRAPSSTAGLAEKYETEDERRARIARVRGGRDAEDTPVDMPAPAQLLRISDRTKAITSSTDDIAKRVHHLEVSTAKIEGEVKLIGQQFANVDGKLDALVEEAKASRDERLERERRAETRAEAELAFRRERTFKIIAIVVPTITAIGTLIAGLAGAFS